MAAVPVQLGSPWPARLAESPPPIPRTPGSIRREIRLVLPPPDGGLMLEATGRDVVTTSDGRTLVVCRSSMSLTAVNLSAPVIASISATTRGPHGSNDDTTKLEPLVGRSARAGFRAAVESLVPSTAALTPGGLLRAMLHDVPIVILLHRAAAPPDELADVPLPYTPPVDICAGYRAGQTLDRWTRVAGPRRLGIGPPATPLSEAAPWPGEDEPGSPAPGTATRRRWIDISTRPGTVTNFTTGFRDTVVERAASRGTETVVHEYRVEGRLSDDRSRFESCVARPIVLPAPECPSAAGSAGWLEGRLVSEVESVIRTTYTGTATCTHLTDALWSIGAIPMLIGLNDQINT